MSKSKAVRQPNLFRVRDLVEILNTCDPNAVVVLSRDEEGNGFSPLFEVTPDLWFKPTGGWGETGEIYEDDERPAGSTRSVVLWPRA